MFGYSDYNQARLEARNTNGEIRGSYQYIDPTGQEVVVQYWSDSLGFHQIDNRPEVVLEPVTDTPEVREARLAHEKAWKEAANLARSGKPIGDLSKPIHNGVDDEDDEIVAALSNQHQSLVRYPSLPYTSHISPEVPVLASSASSDDAVVVEAEHNVKKRENVKSLAESDANEEEPQYDPKGFFYSFEYPVFNIKETDSALARTQGKKVKRSNPEEEPKAGSGITAEDVPVAVPVPAIKSPVVPEADVEHVIGDNRVSLKAVLEGEQLVAAVHDVQVSPKQKVNSEQ